VDKYKIILFLEDNAQEVFIRALVERLISDEGKNLNDYEFRLLNSRGGGSIRAYKDFIKQVRKRNHLSADVLIVGSDGNCNGFLKRKQQLLDASINIPYPEVITAVPDPHIERWYMLDNKALSNAAGVPVRVVSLKVKCDKNHYKTLLKESFADQNLFPPLGGAEYGSLIAKSMDLYVAGKIDRSINDFVDQVLSWLRRH